VLPPIEMPAGTCRRFKQRLQGLSPFETAVGPCRQLKRRFEATFDKVEMAIFLENHRKLNKKLKLMMPKWKSVAHKSGPAKNHDAAAISPALRPSVCYFVF
jgi:hypothetical protein